MTSALLLSGLRTLLDEAQAGFWTDLECYAALSLGQKEHANIIFARFKEKALLDPNEPLPDILKPLYLSNTQNLTVTTGALLPLPPTLWYDIDVYLGDPYYRTMLKRELSRGKTYLETNLYSYGDYYSIDASNIYLEIPAPAGADVVPCTINYLIKTTDISADIEPILPDYTHESFIVYAFSYLLKKSKQYDSAALQLKEFQSLIKYI